MNMPQWYATCKLPALLFQEMVCFVVGINVITDYYLGWTNSWRWSILQETYVVCSAK